MSNFQPLKAVDRGSETEPQVVENLNKNDKGYNASTVIINIVEFTT